MRTLVEDHGYPLISVEREPEHGPHPGEVIDWAAVSDFQLFAGDRGLRWRIAHGTEMTVEVKA